MTTIHIIRHCETVANETHLLQGSCDYPLSVRGLSQLEYLGNRFKNMHIDKIVSSPQRRAYKTAEAVRGVRDIEIIADPALREISCGIYEGKRFADYLKRDPELSDIWHNKPHLFEPRGGERACDVYSRMSCAIERIAKQYEGKTLALTSHGFAIRCLLAYLQFNDITKMGDVIIPCNTAVTTVEFYSDGSHRIVCDNDADHLPPDLKTFFAAR